VKSTVAALAKIVDVAITEKLQRVEAKSTRTPNGTP
jgi:hypothetical protein